MLNIFEDIEIPVQKQSFNYPYPKEALPFVHSSVVSVLFGSHARGDQNDGSDIDLLLLNHYNRKSDIPKTNYDIAVMSPTFFAKLVTEGDAFAYHVINEGRPLDGNLKYLENLKSSFRFKQNYYDEKHEALLMLSYIANYHHRFEVRLLNKKLAWATRSLLIAELMEKRTPLFSESELTRKFDTPCIASLLKMKRLPFKSSSIKDQISNLMDIFGQKSNYINLTDKDIACESTRIPKTYLQNTLADHNLTVKDLTISFFYGWSRF